MNNLTVSLYSDCNFFSLSILETLLSRNCYVNILTTDIKNWTINVSRLSSNRKFAILDAKKLNDSAPTYSVLVLGFGDKEPYEELTEILKVNKIFLSKTLILLPVEKYSYEENSHFNFSGNLGVVYIGDLVGPRMDLKNDLLMTNIIRDIYFNRKMTFAVGDLLYPVFVTDVAKTICRWLFSFGPYGKETCLMGNETSPPLFWRINKDLLGEVNINYEEEKNVRPFPRNIETKQLSGDLKLMLTETYKWLANNPQKKILPFGGMKKEKKIRKKRIYPKFLKPLIITFLFVLLFPVIMLLISSGAFYFSYKEYISGNDAAAQDTVLFAKTFSVISKEESLGLSYIPLLGRPYKELHFISELFGECSDIAVTTMPILRASSDLMNKTLGNQIYNPSNDANVLSAGLDSLYREISFLQADTVEASSNGLLTASAIEKRIDFNKFKNLTLQLKTLSKNLPEIMGANQPKTYMILFQNNMELRPTGGFIGSFGILTFDGGRISNLTINDVYSADGQLLGHVEPPTPIKKYLGEANWWLRDSNWDPDFPTSAQRAEWFLGKETGQTVDGVIAIDLDPIRNILKYTGPVFLSDFDLDVTSDNLYEKTQAEVEQNFFPGTHKKASFLTALSRNLLTEVSKLTSSQKIGVLKSFYTSLSAKSIQMFIHDDGSQNAVSALNWDGSVSTPNCGQDCFADLVGEVEANVGVNKANFFIQRSTSLNVSIASKSIKRTLAITLKNNANPALGPSGIYKTYVRLLSDPDSQISDVQAITGTVTQGLQSDEVQLKGRLETGVYVEILAGETKTIVFTWISNVTNPAGYTKYGLNFRKQAGVEPTPVSLTLNGVNVYNGILAGDYSPLFNW